VILIVPKNFDRENSYIPIIYHKTEPKHEILQWWDDEMVGSQYCYDPGQRACRFDARFEQFERTSHSSFREIGNAHMPVVIQPLQMAYGQRTIFALFLE
jgi:hypothetical protein